MTPDAAVRSKLMRSVARKEFMRFNPARMNIFYAGGMIIAGITTTLLLVTSPEISPKTTSEQTSVAITSTDTVRISEVPALRPAIDAADKKTDSKNGSISNKQLSDNHKKSVSDATVVNDSDNKNPFISVQKIKSIIGKSLLADSGAANKKLQTAFKTDNFVIDPFSSDGCAPLKIKFHNNSASSDSCRWIFGDGGYSNEKDPEWIFDVEGDYKVVLQIFDRNGKSSESAAIVTVHPRPQAHFEISPSRAILPDDEIHFQNYSVNAVKFRWDFGDGSTSDMFEPVHKYSKFSNYDVRLVVYSEWGCPDSLMVNNAFSASEYFIDFPNAFIPNPQGPTGGYYSIKSDEVAQVFHPSFTGVSDYHLKIFSKLGIPIFESNDVDLGWDGYNKGQLCEPGVYIWKVRGRFRNGEPFTKMGDVTLLKN